MRHESHDGSLGRQMFKCLISWTLRN